MVPKKALGIDHMIIQPLSGLSGSITILDILRQAAKLNAEQTVITGRNGINVGGIFNVHPVWC
jgi:hypothetical protein